MTQADIFAVGKTITHGDRVYTLRPPTQYEQGEFQRWLEQRHHDSIDRGPEKPEVKDKRHDRAYVDAAMGKWEWGGPLATEAFWTPAGMAKAIQIVCRDQGVDDLKSEEMVALKFREIAAALVGEIEKDPKLMAQVCASLGLPSDWFSSNCSSPPSTGPSANSADSPTSSSPSSTPSSAAPMG